MTVSYLQICMSSWPSCPYNGTMAIRNFICVLLSGIILIESRTIEKVERVEKKTWHLAMNLNPADGHIMDYTTGWVDDVFIGTYSEALRKDYLDRTVWRHPVSYIALVRHQEGEVDAVKVFRFKVASRSLLSRFQDMDPGREIVTEGGPIEEHISKNAQNMEDDPILSVGGDLAFNWGYTNNGHRIVMTGGYLSPADVNDDKTRGIGNHFYCKPLIGEPINEDSNSASEISILAYPPDIPHQGTDHGQSAVVGPVYGNYAIYASEDASSFPGPGYQLGLEVQVENKMSFF